MSHNKETFELESTTSRKVVAKQIDKVLASCLNQNGDDISVNFRLRLNDQIANSRKRKHRSKSGATVIVSSKHIHPMTLKSNVMTKFYKTLHKRLNSFQKYQSKLVELQNVEGTGSESSGGDSDSDSENYSGSLDDEDEAEEDEEDSDLDYLWETQETKRHNQSLQKKKRKIMSTAKKSENNNNDNNKDNKINRNRLFDNDMDNADYMLYYNTLLHLTNKKHGIFSFISDIISIDIIKIISFQATGEIKLCNICNITEIFFLHDKRYTNNNNTNNLIYCNNCNILLFEFTCCNGQSTNKVECVICDEYYCDDCVSSCEGNYGRCDNSICYKCKEYDDDKNKNQNEMNNNGNNKDRCDECGHMYCHRCLDGCANYPCDKTLCRSCTSREECGYCGHSWEGCSGCIAEHYRWCDSRHSSVDEDGDESDY